MAFYVLFYIFFLIWISVNIYVISSFPQMKGKKEEEKEKKFYVYSHLLLALCVPQSSSCSMVDMLSCSEELADVIVSLGDPGSLRSTWVPGLTLNCQCLLDRAIGTYLGNNVPNELWFLFHSSLYFQAFKYKSVYLKLKSKIWVRMKITCYPKW